MKKFFIIALIFLMTSVFMTAVFAGMAGEQNMKNYFANVIQDRMNCVDANWEQHKIPVMDANEIHLESVATDIKFEPSGSESIEVEYATQTYDRPIERTQIFSRSGRVIKFDLTEFVGDEHKLQFDFKSGKGFTLNIENVPLLVRVPRHIKKIKINTTSGDVKIVKLNFEQVTIDSISANVRFKNADVADFKFTTYSGDLKFSGKLGQIEASTISGNLKFELENNNSHAKIQTTSGDVKAKLKLQKGQWDVQSVSGSFKIVENAHFESSYLETEETRRESKVNTETKIKKCSDFRVFGISFN